MFEILWFMNEEQKLSIIYKGKQYFREIIIPNHLKGLGSLRLKDFNVNPFLVNYLASFLCGNTEPESIAKALVCPRILGTSILNLFPITSLIHGKLVSLHFSLEPTIFVFKDNNQTYIHRG